MQQQSLFKGYFLLIISTMIWGGAFVFQKNATEMLDALSFNFVRFSVATPALLALFILPKKLFNPESKNAPWYLSSDLFVGVIAGFFMFSLINLQQWALSFTIAGKAGFLTALYIVIVPILSFVILKEKTKIQLWLGGVCCILGLFFLGGGVDIFTHSSFNQGDIIILVSALVCAGYVFWIGLTAKYTNALKIVFYQSVVTAILSFLGMKLNGGVIPSFEIVNNLKMEIFYTAILSGSIAFILQILGQRFVPVANAAIVMSCESIFALFAGMLLLNERLSFDGIMGCIFIFVGILISQIEGNLLKNE